MKNKKMLLGLSVALFWGCTDSSPDDLIEIIPIEEVTYQEHVKPIIDNNCVACHSLPPINGAPNALTNYEHVKAAVQNQGLIDRMSRQNGDDQLMPLGGPKLPQNLINVIIQWQNQGFKN